MKKIVFGTLGLCMVLALASMASAQTARLRGTGKNVNAQTRGGGRTRHPGARPRCGREGMGACHTASLRDQAHRCSPLCA